MVRAKTNVARKRRVKRVMKRAKGFQMGRRRLYRSAIETIERADAFAFRDRRAKKRSFRRLWITRIGAACRALGVTYSAFMDGLKKAKIEINRKELSQLAIEDAGAFAELVKTAQAARAG